MADTTKQLSEAALPSTPLTVNFDLEPRDLKAFQAFASRHVPTIRRARYFSWGLIVFTSFYCAVTYLHKTGERIVAFFFTLVPLSLLCGALFLLLRVVMHWRAYTAEKMSGIICRHTVTLSEEGIHEVTPANESRWKWGATYSVADTQDHLFLFVNTQMAFIVPKRAFPDAGAAQQFLERARALHLAAKQTQP